MKNSKNIKRFVLRYISLPLVSVLLILAIGFWWTSYLIDISKEHVFDNSRNHVVALSSFIRGELKVVNKSAQSLTFFPSVKSVFLNKNSTTLKNANKILDRYQEIFNVSVCYLMDMEGNTIASSNRNSPASFVGKNYGFRPYFKKATKGNMGTYFALGVTSGKRGYYVGHPVKTEDDNIIGVAVIKKELDNLEKTFTHEGSFYFISPDGVVFLSNSSDALFNALWPVNNEKKEILKETKQFGHINYKEVFPEEITGSKFLDLENGQFIFVRDFIHKGWSLVFLNKTNLIFIYKLFGILSTSFTILMVLIFFSILFFNNVANKKIKDSKERLSLALYGGGLGTWDWDLRTDEVVFNERWAEMKGYNLDEVEPHLSAWKNLVHPEDFPEVYKILNDYLEGRSEFYKAEFRMKHKSGKWIWIFDKGKIIERDKEGNPIRVCGTHLDITERKNAEIKLQKLTVAMEQAPISVVITDLEGKFEYVNPKFCTLTGYLEKEVLGKNPRILQSGKTPKRTYKQLWKTILAGETWQGEFYNNKKNGKLYCEEAIISPLLDKKGDITHFVGVKEDITMRKEEKEKIERLNILLRTISNVNQIIVGGSNREQLIKRICSELTETRGYIYAWVVLVNKENNFVDAFESGIDKEFNSMYEDIKKGEIPRCVKKVLSEENFFVVKEPDSLCSECPMYDMHKNRKGMIICLKYGEKRYGVLRVTISENIDLNEEEISLFKEVAGDISLALHHIDIENDLKRSETKHRMLYESSRDAIMMLTVEEGFIDGNPATLEMFECKDKEEFVSFSPGDLSPKFQPDGQLSLEKAPKMIKIALEKGSHFFEWEHKTVKGIEFPAEVLLNRVQIEGKKVIQATVRNIATRKKYEENLEKRNKSIDLLNQKLKKRNEKLEYLSKMKSDFVSTVSHELRTPLTSIKESINLISEEIPGKVNKDQKRFLEICESNVDRLSRLIGQVLDSQKIRTGKMEFNFEKNNVNEVVKEGYRSMVVVTDEKGLSLDLELDKNLPEIKFDKDRILQVLTNLVNNAIKFTDKGGITIITKRKKNIVKVSVKDTGYGIKEQDIDSLFQDFKQLGGVNERKVGGTGLGLSISKKIVNTHGGKIWVESKFEEGATFSFVLPIKERRKR